VRKTSGLAVRHDPGNQCVQMGFSTQEQHMLLLLLLLLAPYRSLYHCAGHARSAIIPRISLDRQRRT